MFYEYADSGSWNQETYFANQNDFSKIKFRQRVGIDIENRSLSKKFMGTEVSLPLALSSHRFMRYATSRWRNTCCAGK